MTKEEYEKLLRSDYWKGYSYSIIKERNFTCEDCGRRFYNERNKLQVHHLVYRNVKPWSYKPEELIVLCNECHKRRHGITTMPQPNPSASSPSMQTGGYSKSYSYSHGNKEYGENIFNNFSIPSFHPVWRFITRHKRFILYGFAVLFLWGIIANESDKATTNPYKDKTKSEVLFSAEERGVSKSARPQNNKIASPHKGTVAEMDTERAKQEDIEITENNEVFATSESNPPQEDIENINPIASSTSKGEEKTNDIPQREETILEILERKNHEDVVKQAKRAGVSTEGTTLEILERINHADVVKQAKRAGVSTEGTTLEILERINHADVVKQAKRAGVSTEGTTLEILERINHADVIKQAKRAGVSTEGTTLEILERINRKELEKYN